MAGTIYEKKMPDTSQLTTYARLLRLTPVDVPLLTPATAPAEAPCPSPAAESGGWWRRQWRRQASHEGTENREHRRRWPKGIMSLLLLMFLPTCVAVGYFWLLAADRYESEARFVLRTPGNKALPGASIANLLPGAGAARANDDGHIVREFLESRDAARLLEKTAGLREAFAPARMDPFWRFPNLFTSNTEEGFYRHFQRLITADFNSTTGVSTLKMQAFSPEDAQRLAAALLEAAEGLVNRLNERAKRDAIGLSEAVADRMRIRTLAAQAALTAFREREQLVDPGQATLAVLETIAKLSQEAAQVSVQLNELGKASPNAPQLSSLRTRRAALETQIAIERHRLAGDAQSIAPRIVEYERLMLEREFAERALLAAMTSVEMARVEALRQQVYLERVTTPSRPDYPAYPWRIIWSLTVLAAGYMVWRIWRVLAVDALRHNTP